MTYRPRELWTCAGKTATNLELQVAKKWSQDSTYTVEAAAITGALISLLIKVVLIWALVRLVHRFGQGLRERSE